MGRAIGTAATSAILMTLLLTGCVAAPIPAPPTVTVTATVTATPAPPAVTATPLPPPVVEPVPNAPAPEVELGPASDLGTRDGATGSPVVDGDGMLVSYTVVEGDSFFDIAQRFNLPQQQLLRMNPQIHDFGETVYIGDVINLDWTKTG